MLTFGALYSLAEADWTGLNLETPSYINDATLVGTLYSLEAVSAITDYSDLEFVQTELNFGGTYTFSPALYLTAAAGYEIFEDNSPYVYGDQDGTAWSGNVGVGYRF
ncbi:MAG: hypothetical protein C0621_01970 [Desulfuromonas sp.]|mgnify:CR=1 FL=1|nr:MAG: hypothetical protein C0621_01970 [Desulfuromonas sp.]